MMRIHSAVVALIVLTQIIFTTYPALAAKEPKYLIHEPQTTFMGLVTFTPKLIKTPFIIQYPGKWYAREEDNQENTSALFLSQEPLRNVEDRYQVGMAMYSFPKHFAKSKESWDVTKEKLVNTLRQRGLTVTRTSEVTVSEKQFFRVDYESPATKLIALHLRDKSQLFSIIFEAPAGQFEGFRDTFESMIRSLSFNDR